MGPWNTGSKGSGFRTLKATCFVNCGVPAKNWFSRYSPEPQPARKKLAWGGGGFPSNAWISLPARFGSTLRKNGEKCDSPEGIRNLLVMGEVPRSLIHQLGCHELSTDTQPVLGVSRLLEKMDDNHQAGVSSSGPGSFSGRFPVLISKARETKRTPTNGGGDPETTPPISHARSWWPLRGVDGLGGSRLAVVVWTKFGPRPSIWSRIWFSFPWWFEKGIYHYWICFVSSS